MTFDLFSWLINNYIRKMSLSTNLYKKNHINDYFSLKPREYIKLLKFKHVGIQIHEIS